MRGGPIRLFCVCAGLAGVTSCNVAIQHGLAEPEANQILTVLEQGGIAAHKLREEGTDPVTFTVEVGSSNGTRALELLRTHGLPRGRRSGFAEIYGKPSLIPTRTEERARFLEALTGELERTLESVDGVAQARVHLVLEERDPLAPDDSPRIPASAAVLLKVRTGPAPLSETDVQRLVSGSVPGLAAERVSVVLTAAPELRASTVELVAIGPLRVAPGSRAPLIAGIVAGLLLIALLAVLLLMSARRLSHARQTPPAPTP